MSARVSLQLTASYCKSLQRAASIRISRNVGHLVTACIYLQQLTPFISHLLSHTRFGQMLSIPRRVHRFLRFKRSGQIGSPHAKASRDAYVNAPAAAGSASPNLHAEGAARSPSLLGGLDVRSRQQGCRFLPQQDNVPRDDRPDQGVVDGRVLISELIAKIDDPPRI